MKKLPKFLYVLREKEGKEDEYFVAYQDMDDFEISIGERRIIGRYALMKSLCLAMRPSHDRSPENRKE